MKTVLSNFHRIRHELPIKMTGINDKDVKWLPTANPLNKPLKKVYFGDIVNFGISKNIKNNNAVNATCRVYTSVITACDQNKGDIPNEYPAIIPACQFS